MYEHNSNKFGRNYYIEFRIGELVTTSSGNYDVEVKDRITIGYPISADIHTDVKLGGGSNSANVILYNLSEETMCKLWLDEINKTKKVEVLIHAGYGNDTPLIFQGYATSIYSYRNSGSTEVITEVNIGDSLFMYLYGFDSYTVAKDTTVKGIIDQMLGKVNVFKEGYISPTLANKKVKSNQNLTGCIADLLHEEYPQYDMLINKGELHILAENEVIPSNLPYISYSTGLLGTPQRRGNFLYIETIFEPRLNIAQAVKVEPTLLKSITGTYKIFQITHDCTFSPNNAGKAITKVQCGLHGASVVELKKEETSYIGSSTAKSGFVRPVSDAITSEYGKRNVPGSTFHEALDFGCKDNTPVKSTANGKVITIAYKTLNGNYLVIDHGTVDGHKVQSWYLHLNNYNVSVGDNVVAGQVVAYSGHSGQGQYVDYAPHLDFRIKQDGHFVNPHEYIGR